MELRHIVRSFRPDLIHAVSLKNVLLSGILARTERVPALLGAVTGLGTMFVENSLVFRLLKPIVLQGIRFGQNHENAVLALENPDDREYFLRKKVVSAQRAFLIPGAGVDPNLLTPASQSKSLPQILCVTRMIRNKGILELTDAATQLRAKGIEFELTLVGDVDPGNPTSLTEEQLGRIQTTGVANWLGKRSDIPDLLESASIFCLPSYYREGMPRALIEAAAAGLPIVTTDIPGCREIVENGVNGFLVPPRDVQGLTEALGRLICSRELRIKMGAASRLRFQGRFTTSHDLEAFNRCYAALNIPLVLCRNGKVKA